MPTRYIRITAGTTATDAPFDRTAAKAAGIISDSSDSYDLKYRRNGTFTRVANLGASNLDLFRESSVDSIVAHSGGTQALATPLTGQTSRVITVGAANDSVSLPASAAGLEILVINHGANAMQVFGAGTDTIDDVATATGVSQMASSLVIYSCATAGSWYSEGLATGYGGPGLATMSSQDTLTAKSGGGQQLGTVAPVINKMINRITTVAVAGDSVTLPTSVAGMNIVIVNAAAANSMNVFPILGDAINALSVNTQIAVAANKTATFYCATAGVWHSILTA